MNVVVKRRMFTGIIFTTKHQIKTQYQNVMSVLAFAMFTPGHSQSPAGPLPESSGVASRDQGKMFP